MLTLISMVVGFLSSGVPEIFKFLNKKSDNAQELSILKLQGDQQAAVGQQRIEEVRIAGEAQALVAESNRIAASMKPTGIKWVDGFSGLVRPAITFLMFAAWAAVKGWRFSHGESVMVVLWSDEDQALFGSVVGFWFGDRGHLHRAGK